MNHDHRAASAKTYFDLGLAVEHSDFLTLLPFLPYSTGSALHGQSDAIYKL